MRKTLYVSPAQGSWKVHWEGQSTGNIYATKERAISEARKLVGSLPAGACSQIIVQRSDGTFQTEWTYGSDPFPPAG